MKFLMICSYLPSALNFRGKLLEAIHAQGYEIHVFAPDLTDFPDELKQLQQLGYQVHGIRRRASLFNTDRIDHLYHDPHKKGYDLTERLFDVLRSQHVGLVVIGPERAGKDVLLGNVFKDYPKPDRPVDFVIYDGKKVLAIGLARYDSDRGGAQEDDRTGQYREVAQEIIGYADSHGMQHIKVIYVNDGPGLLLGSMWNDYSYIEDQWPGRVKVVTLRMVPDRITAEWLGS